MSDKATFSPTTINDRSWNTCGISYGDFVSLCLLYDTDPAIQAAMDNLKMLHILCDTDRVSDSISYHI